MSESNGNGFVLEIEIIFRPCPPRPRTTSRISPFPQRFLTRASGGPALLRNLWGIRNSELHAQLGFYKTIVVASGPPRLRMTRKERKKLKNPMNSCSFWNDALRPATTQNHPLKKYVLRARCFERASVSLRVPCFGRDHRRTSSLRRRPSSASGLAETSAGCFGERTLCHNRWVLTTHDRSTILTHP